MNADYTEQRLARIERSLFGLLRRGSGARRVLLTGGTGTLGVALTEYFLNDGYELTIVSRDGHRQAQYQQRYPQVRCIQADICDYDAMLAACIGQTIIVHAAAQKRVDVGETQIAEFYRVNVEGTRVVAQAAYDAGAHLALFISSDKAVAPINFYGMTKAIGERIWLARNDIGGALPARFSAVRYGNVMGSNGSVLKVWRERRAQGLPIVVREPETTRFFMTVDDAVKLVDDALLLMEGGEIFVPTNTPAFGLYDLANEVEPDDTYWQRAPLGPREKQHEALIAPGEYFEPVDELPDEPLVRVWPNRSGGFSVPSNFTSNGARRLTGVEAIECLESA